MAPRWPPAGQGYFLHSNPFICPLGFLDLPRLSPPPSPTHHPKLPLEEHIFQENLEVFLEALSPFFLFYFFGL
jgi:hypothetical protein